MKKPTIDIVIPSYNGRHLLEKHLPAIIKNSPQVNKIIIIDDGGSDDTKEFLGKNFPKTKYLENSKNLGFPKTVNRGVGQSKADYVVLLNNDVSPQKNYLVSATKILKNYSVFAVTFNESTSSWPLISWNKGKIHFTRAKDKSKTHYSAWASGGSSILKRKIWNQLGGFNPIYSPGYWEDIDLGWRAWKAGYHIVWDPGSKVTHQHESTFKSLDQNKLNLLKQRNELLFHWQNITDISLTLSHLSFLIRHTLTHPGYSRVIAITLPHLFKVISSRSHKTKLTDRETLSQVNLKTEI